MKKPPSLPFHLAHKPFLALPYTKFDGVDPEDTDAHYLSIGRAQWADHYEGQVLSAKVFRHSDQRWSRQSEELPLHRVIDLSTMVALAMASGNATRVEIPANTFEGQTEAIDLPLYEQINLDSDTEALVRRRFVSLLKTLNRLHPEIVEEALSDR